MNRGQPEKVILLSGEYKLPKYDGSIDTIAALVTKFVRQTAMQFVLSQPWSIARGDTVTSVRYLDSKLRPATSISIRTTSASTPIRTRRSAGFGRKRRCTTTTQHDFYALSRFDDVNKALVDHETFSSGAGRHLELIKANIEIPPGTLIFEDPAASTTSTASCWRGCSRHARSTRWSRRSASSLRAGLDPLGRQRAVRLRRRPRRGDADAGDQRCCSASPRSDQEMIRDHANAQMRTEAGKPMKHSEDGFVTGEIFADYIDWRADHPSDDIMTELLNVGVRRRDRHRPQADPRRTAHLPQRGGRRGQRDHHPADRLGGQGLGRTPRPAPRTRRGPALIPQAIEELLRFEPPAPHVARYVTRDVEIHGQTVPQGSTMMMLIGAADARPPPVPARRRCFRHPPRSARTT